MRSSVRILIGALLFLAIETLTPCATAQRLRLIRRITASDLPPSVNSSGAAILTQQSPANVTSAATNTPTVLNITEVFGTTSNRPLRLNITEILDTSATTHRRQLRPVTELTGTPLTTTTTELPKANVSEAQFRSRRLNLRIRTSLKSVETSTETPKRNVTVNILKPVNGTVTEKSNLKDLNVAETITKSLNNETNSISPTKEDIVKGSVNTTLNCTSDCEQKSAANKDKTVVISNITADKVVETKETSPKEITVKSSPKEKLVESSTVKPTDRTFNKIVSSSTARIVLQEKIHTDILKHLTTASYEHYETDYVLDLDDVDVYEAESKHASTKSYDHYDTKDDYNVTTKYTTPSTKKFDEAFARVSEGIRQNLDERSEDYAESSNEHYSSSEKDERIANEGLPKNDSKVTLEYVNRVNIISNDSATANSKRGDLFVDNGTRVDFERKFVQTKIEPEISSTIKYIIDDEYSTTRRIITRDEESNSIKEDVGSEEKVQDRHAVGAESGSDEQAAEQQLEGDESGSDENPLDQRLASAEDDLVRVKIEATNVGTKRIDKTGTSNSTENVTTMRTSTQGRGRMFPTETLSSYNNNNTVEIAATETLAVKHAQGQQDAVDDITTAYAPRSRTTSPTLSSMSSRSFTSDVMATSPKSNVIIRRPTLRRTNNTRLGDLDVNNEGNDIVVNDSFRTTIRRGTVKFGTTARSESEDFPIPPTAAAWSLATMKEPGRRTKLQVSNSTTLRPKQIADSEASGSFSKQTTLLNVIAPTTDANSTSSKYDSDSVGASVVGSVEKPEVTEVTTESANVDVATDMPTTMNPLNEEVTTRQPDEMTTSAVANGDNIDDEDLRFDGVLPTTTHSSETGEVTTEYDVAATTTESYETTEIPREFPDKVVEEKDEEGDVTTQESVLAEDGSVLDMQESEGSHGLAGVNKDIPIGPKLHEIKEEASIVDVGQGKGSGDGITKGHGGEEEADYGGSTGPEAETDSPIHLVAKIAEVVPSTLRVNTVYEKNSSTTSKPPIDTTTTPLDTTMTPLDTTTTPRDTTITPRDTTMTPHNRTMTGTTIDSDNEVTANVHTFMRVFVESSLEEFCSLMTIFKKAVADLLTEGTSRTVTISQVILRNIGPDQCSDKEALKSSRNDADTGHLIPVEMHIVDEKSNYDQVLNDAFPLLWGHKDLDFQLRIRKVDVVDESLAYSGSSNNGAVIAAITISCIGAICLLILAILLVVMRKRQKKVNYGMRCTPVSLDAYSLDSVSVHGSTRRKGGLRASKRSYGNPAFDDSVAPTHPMNFASLAIFSTDRAGVEEEFSEIPHVTPKSDELPDGAETKNRYANIIPLPETRVILTSSREEPLSDYINANYVRGPKNAIKCYIACQAPLQSTVTDFWRMVWQQQTKVIMMLTDLVENGVEKCADYLPPSEVLDCHRVFGDYQVTLKKREVRETYVISTLQLKNLHSNTWREITHLWYLSWPGQGVPEEPSSIIAFLIEARSYMKNSTGPSIVHCSPGTGRTGVVLACDLGIREFEQTRLVDIPRCVYRLRKDRAGCVQTRDQYAFIYQVLNLYATKLTGGALDSI